MIQITRFQFYWILAAIYMISIIVDWEIYLAERHLEHGINTQITFGGRMKYLTFINLNLQFIYFLCCAINESIKKFGEKIEKLENFCNVLYTSFAFPVGLCVTLGFWGVFAIDRDLIYPEILEKIVPSYQNHLVHTFPLISVILDSFMTEHKYSNTFFGIFSTALFAKLYGIWIFIIAYFGGIWVYPILQVLSPVHRIVFILFFVLLSCMINKGGEVLNKAIWKTKTNSYKTAQRSEPINE